MGPSLKCKLSSMIGASMDAAIALYEWDLQLGKVPKHKGGSHNRLLSPFTTPKAGQGVSVVSLVGFYSLITIT